MEHAWKCAHWKARVVVMLLFAAPFLSGKIALAQGWPAKPVKIVVSTGPGLATDIIARIAAQRLTEAFGRTAVVENPGTPLPREPTEPSPQHQAVFGARRPQVV